MKAQVIQPIVIDPQDRTVDLTLQISADNGTPLFIDSTISMPIDGFTRTKAVHRIRGRIIELQIQQSPIPFTQAQIEAAILNAVVIIPDS